MMHQMWLGFYWSIKGALLGLRLFFGNWEPFKNDEKYFLFDDVTAWLTNNCNTNIAQYLVK